MLGSPQRPRGRLVPVVEIRTGRGIKRPVQSPNRPSSPAPECSPRKRGRMRNREESPVASSVQEAPSRPVSPTASDYILASSRASAHDWEMDATQPPSSRISRVQSKIEDNPTPYLYEITDEEIEESSDLEVSGEILPEDDDSEDDDDERVPVRLLDGFTFYDPSTMEVIPSSLLSLCRERQYVASGIVRRWMAEESDFSDDEVEEDDDADQAVLHSKLNRVQLTKILEFNIHDVTHRPKEITLDGKIYVRTKHAWYILGNPSIEYSPFFVPFWRNHRITHLLLSSILKDPATEEPEFCEALPDLDGDDNQVATALDILGRAFEEQDYYADEVQAYLLSALVELRTELKITRAHIVRKLVSLSEEQQPFPTEFKNKKGPKRAAKGQKPKDRDHASNQPRTFTTPTVSRMSQNLFEVKMDVAKGSALEPDPLSEDDDDDDDVEVKAHKFDTNTVKWGKPIPGKLKQYAEVRIEDTLYKINDVVMVVADNSYSGKHNFGRTTNEYGNTMWFCQIKKFFEKSGEKMFHGQWFLHGSKTVLHELAHPQAIYPTNMCDDNFVNCIYTKCKVRFLKPGELEPLEDLDSQVNNFHCGLFYHHEFAEFVNLPPSFLDSLNESGKCSSCEFEDEEDDKCTPTASEEGLAYGGIVYHVDDFIYLIPPDENCKLFLIAQIVGIIGKSTDNPSIRVRFHKRHSDLERVERVEPFCHPDNLGLFIDERRLILTSDDVEIDDRSPLCLGGHCHVRQLSDPTEIEEWIQHDDHFYVKDIMGDNGKPRRLKPGELKVCSTCLKEREGKLHDREEFMAKAEKLVGLELFSGAGGLGYGMELSGAVETKYAVEFSPSAALTYKKNHPHATVCCQDSNTILRHVVARDNGEKPPPLRMADGTKCPEMPKKGEKIDFIFGGPPCQAFSRMNHSRRADDIRSTMPCNMLSYVEYYQPKYFLLENVAGLLDYRLSDNRDLGPSVPKGAKPIRFGMVKFILRTLIALGYQVRYKLLQAVQYGVPQSRTRIIFWGAKRGLTLPEFPVPVYAFPKGVARASMPTGEQGKLTKIPPPSRWKSKKAGNKHDRLFHQCAPFEMVTVFAAIGDLPAFDWKNPHLVVSRAKNIKHKKEEANRTTWFGEVIPELDAVTKTNKPVGFTRGTSYATKAQNRYQKWLRKDMEQPDKGKKPNKKGKGRADGELSKVLVKYHYTTRHSAKHVEATATVPLFPGAYHVNLPQALWPSCALPGRRQVNQSFFGRVDGDQYFKCAMTKMSPSIKHTWPLHPLQRRIYTVQECARAQGFPDHYEFCSVHDLDKEPAKVLIDQIKQIGNAVAVPFALALGKELREVCITDWKENDQREYSVEL